MPMMCECERPSVRPSNPHVCIVCGGQRLIGSPPCADEFSVRRDLINAQREIPRDSFGNYDPPDELLDWEDDQR